MLCQDLRPEEELHVIGEHLEEIPHCHHPENVRSLNLHANRITQINPVISFTHLVELVISSNEIRHMGPISGLIHLRSLDLSCNRLTSIEGLSNLVNLRRLCLSYNLIPALAGFSECWTAHHQLEEIDMRDNLVSHIEELVYLAGVKPLKVVNFQNASHGQTNPVCAKYQEYQSALMKACPNLSIMDQKSVPTGLKEGSQLPQVFQQVRRPATHDEGTQSHRDQKFRATQTTENLPQLVATLKTQNHKLETDKQVLHQELIQIKVQFQMISEEAIQKFRDMEEAQQLNRQKEAHREEILQKLGNSLREERERFHKFRADLEVQEQGALNEERQRSQKFRADLEVQEQVSLEKVAQITELQDQLEGCRAQQEIRASQLREREADLCQVQALVHDLQTQIKAAESRESLGLADSQTQADLNTKQHSELSQALNREQKKAKDLETKLQSCRRKHEEHCLQSTRCAEALRADLQLAENQGHTWKSQLTWYESQAGQHLKVLQDLEAHMQKKNLDHQRTQKRMEEDFCQIITQMKKDYAGKLEETRQLAESRQAECQALQTRETHLQAELEVTQSRVHQLETTATQNQEDFREKLETSLKIKEIELEKANGELLLLRESNKDLKKQMQTALDTAKREAKKFKESLSEELSRRDLEWQEVLEAANRDISVRETCVAELNERLRSLEAEATQVHHQKETLEQQVDDRARALQETYEHKTTLQLQGIQEEGLKALELAHQKLEEWESRRLKEKEMDAHKLQAIQQNLQTVAQEKVFLEMEHRQLIEEMKILARALQKSEDSLKHRECKVKELTRVAMELTGL